MLGKTMNNPAVMMAMTSSAYMMTVLYVTACHCTSTRCILGAAAGSTL